MAKKKKDKAKAPKGKRIKVAKVKKKKPRASKKRKRAPKGKGQYSNFFPTNRQIDSNQYWQLRAEIAGAEARVRSRLKDRQDEESKAERRAEETVGRLEQQVQVLQNTPPPPAPVAPAPTITVNPAPITIDQPITIGTPAQPTVSPAQAAVAGGEYDGTEGASAQRDATSDQHQVDLTAETPTRSLEPEPERLVEHRGETFEEQEQRKQQQYRDATKFRQQSKLRQVGNIVSRWKTVSDTGKAKSELQQENKPQTPHNIHVTSSDTDTPTRRTVQSVIDTGAPPASAVKAQQTKQSKRKFLLSAQTVSPIRVVSTTSDSGTGPPINEYSIVREEASVARGQLFPGETFSQASRAASQARDKIGDIDL